MEKEEKIIELYQMDDCNPEYREWIAQSNRKAQAVCEEAQKNIEKTVQND